MKRVAKKPNPIAKASDAIIALGQRHGSSLPDLKNYLKLSEAQLGSLRAALKSGVESGALVENEGKYKVSRAPTRHELRGEDVHLALDNL